MAKRVNKRESGQGVAEYIIIVALIAIAAIGIVALFGEQIRSMFAASGRPEAAETSRRDDARKKKRRVRAVAARRETGDKRRGAVERTATKRATREAARRPVVRVPSSTRR